MIRTICKVKESWRRSSPTLYMAQMIGSPLTVNIIDSNTVFLKIVRILHFKIYLPIQQIEKQVLKEAYSMGNNHMIVRQVLAPRVDIVHKALMKEENNNDRTCKLGLIGREVGVASREK